MWDLLTLFTLCYFIFEFWYCYFYRSISALLLSCMYTIYHVYCVKPYLISIIYNFYYCKTKIESNIRTFTQILHDCATFRCLNIYIYFLLFYPPQSRKFDAYIYHYICQQIRSVVTLQIKCFHIQYMVGCDPVTTHLPCIKSTLWSYCKHI